MPARSRLAIAAIVMTAATCQGAEPPTWPTPADVQRARERSPFPGERRLGAEPIPGLPNIEPRRPNLDLETILKPRSASRPLPAAAPLRVFVTLGMPRASLQRLAEQSTRTGAVLVLRGLKDDSMRATLAALQTLTGDAPGAWVIDPAAFARLGIQQAPTFVLALQGAGSGAPPACATQCAGAPEHLRVSGDVSLDHALEALRRHHPAARAAIDPLLQRLRGNP